MADRYFLGSTAGENDRLPARAEAFAPDARALLDLVDVRPGWRAVDVGCGPLGVLELLAERVGPEGAVVGLEREARFAEAARATAARRGLASVTVHERDARDSGLPAYRLTRSRVGPKPVAGRLPVLIGGSPRPAVERAARIGDGFVTVLADRDMLATHVGWYRDAGGAGPIVMRVNAPRIETTDLARAAAAGVDEVVWDANVAGIDPRRQIADMEALSGALAA